MKVSRVLLCVALALAPLASFAQLSQAAVQRLIADMDRAISQKDVAGVARLLSDDVTIEVTVRAVGQSQKMALTKSTYVDMLTKAWAAASSYEYKRSNVKITLSGPSRAVVSATAKEKTVVNGETFFASTSESAVIEIIGGRPLITRIAANTQM